MTVRRPRICVVGSGGREHALALALARTAEVVVAPGNAGIAAGGGTQGGRGPITCTAAPPEEIDADLFVIGPEAPLVDGLADRLRARGRRVVGPGAAGARLEGSKAFMKDVLGAAGVPTARHGVFADVAPARAFLRSLPGPWVVKTDGPAAGKGVLVAATLEEAEEDVAAKLAGSFGAAGRRVVVEEGLAGPECSLLVLCDGATAVPLPPAQDHKRIGEGDTGPNTGGMGACAPVPGLPAAAAADLMERAVEPLVHELRRRGVDYRGVLFAGLMLAEDGPRVLEYNVRFGDPETQAVLPLLDADLVDVLGAVADGRLASAVPAGRLDETPRSSVCVVLAAAHYPAEPRLGDEITGLDASGQLQDPVPGVVVVHAGTRRAAGSGRGAGTGAGGRAAGPFAVAGGRVLGITAVADDLAEARRRAYAAVERVRWPGMQWRRDIGEHLPGVVAARP